MLSSSSAPQSQSQTHRTEDSESPPSGLGEGEVRQDDMIETIVGADEKHFNGTASDRNENATQEPINLARDPGDYGGLSLLRRVHKLCKHVSGMKLDGDNDLPNDDLSTSFEVAPPDTDLSISWETFALLPSRESVTKAIDIVVDEATCNMHFLTRANLQQIADEVFEDMETESTAHARRPLALIYAVVALSRLFHPIEQRAKGAKQTTTLNGLRYFRASRALLDPASCRNLISLQTLLCLILYTNGASMLSTCYSYICMAVAASLQIGLFTDLSRKDLPEENSTRRMTFSVLAICDTFVTLALGLPRTLRDIDPQRSLPIADKPTDIRSPLYGTYMQAQLTQILATTVEANHPFIRPIEAKNGFYGVESSKIVATEARLDYWYRQLEENQISGDAADDASVMRSQLMLRLYHAQVQMVLYRPFLHHALGDAQRGSSTSLKAYACGSACIKAAMQAVWLVERLETSSLLSTAHWHVTYVITFTAASLCLFVTCNRGAPTVAETEDAVRRIKGVCSRNADANASLRRCHQFLESIPSHGPRDADIANQGLWHTFMQSTSTFADAVRATEEFDQEDANGDDMLQAVSLPQLQPLLNGRL
ncbi:Gypsy retrotransposon integrase-like protein 1 [Friedmanniomyces endolithicus]|nr:Gypsy retrotransposon integrase-like protein 1 [Friedmanniomyces endolithicus]